MRKTLLQERVLERTFETPDMGLAASIFALGADLIAIDRKDPGRCEFVFADSPDVRRAAQAFWSRQLSLEPQTLLAALKAIKGRLYGERL